jgi:hypothetical protein
MNDLVSFYESRKEEEKEEECKEGCGGGRMPFPGTWDVITYAFEYARTEPEVSNPDCCTIQFRLPDSTSVTWRFLKSDLGEVLKKFIAFHLKSQDFWLLLGMPPKQLEDFKLTLEELELFPRSKIIVDSLND